MRHRGLHERLDAAGAALAPPAPRAGVDPRRLTPARRERMAELRERVDAVGMGNLTDDEVAEGAALTEILLGRAPGA